MNDTVTSAEAGANVVHNEPEQRFELRVDGVLCRADYARDGDVLRMYHTEVPQVLAGRGLAALLVKAAADHARAHRLKIQPACSYVRVWLQRHPDYQDVQA